MPTHPVDGKSGNWSNVDYLEGYFETLNSELDGSYFLGCGIHGLSNEFWLDLDNCFFDNHGSSCLEEWALLIVNFALRMKLYMEVSVSGTGLHIAGACADIDHAIHAKHVYSKSSDAKSKAVELFLSTDTDQCKRGLLLTGDLYQESLYESKHDLPVITKKDLVDLLHMVKATKLVQVIERSRYRIEEKKAGIEKEDVRMHKKHEDDYVENDIIDLALFDDKIRYLYNGEDILDMDYRDSIQEYSKIYKDFHKKVSTNSASENDFLYVLYLTRYTTRRERLINCLVDSPRGIHDDRKDKMHTIHSADGLTYAQLTVDRALAVGEAFIKECAREGEICLSFEAGMRFMNSRYLKYHDNQEVKIIEYYFQKKENYTFGVYTKKSVEESLANLYFISKDKDGLFVKRKLFSVWFNDANTKLFKGYRFSPGKESVLYDCDSHNLYCNTFRGWTVKPKRSDLSKTWIDYVREVICSNDEEDSNYFFDYFAHLFQKPNHHVGVALVLKSDKGIGKNLILEPIQYILGKNLYFMSTKTKDLAGDFNKNVQAKLLIIANEALIAGDPAAQDNLKGLVADKEISITAKHHDSKSEDNYSRVVILSNRSNVLTFDPTERRYRYFNCNDEFSSVQIRNHPVNLAKQKHLIDIINSEEYLKDQTGLSRELQEGLLDYFLLRDISTFNPREFEFGKNAGTIRTESTNSVSQFFYEFIETGRFCVDNSTMNHLKTIKEYYAISEELCINPEELHVCYVEYHKKYCLRSALLDLRQFRKKFSDYFLKGSLKTDVKRISTKETLRVWMLGTRGSLAVTHEIDTNHLL